MPPHPRPSHRCPGPSSAHPARCATSLSQGSSTVPRPPPQDSLSTTNMRGSPCRKVGSRSMVIDSEDRPIAVIEITGVRVVPLAQVDLAHVVDEGEGDTSVAEWRAGHERLWHTRRCALGWRTPNLPWTTRRWRFWNASASSRTFASPIHHPPIVHHVVRDCPPWRVHK